MQGKERAYYSRFQVLTQGERAWTMDEREVVYLYDGSCFRRRGRRGGSYTLVTSWRSSSLWLDAPPRLLLSGVRSRERS